MQQQIKAEHQAEHQAEREPAATTGRGWWRRWPDWAPLAAGTWSLLYGLLGVWWTLGGSGLPYGEGDPDAVGSLLGGVPTAVGAPVVAVLGLAGAVAPRRRWPVPWAMSRSAPA